MSGRQEVKTRFSTKKCGSQFIASPDPHTAESGLSARFPPVCKGVVRLFAATVLQIRFSLPSKRLMLVFMFWFANDRFPMFFVLMVHFDYILKMLQKLKTAQKNRCAITLDLITSVDFLILLHAFIRMNLSSRIKSTSNFQNNLFCNRNY